MFIWSNTVTFRVSNFFWFCVNLLVVVDVVVVIVIYLFI